MNDDFSSSPSSSRIFEIAFRNRKTLVLFPLCALLLGMMVLMFAPRAYRSEAKLFLRVGRESVGIDPTVRTGETIMLQQGDRKDEVKSAIDVLTSRGVISQAVDLVGPEVVLGKAPLEGDDSGGGIISSIVGLPVRMLVGLYRCIDPISDRERAIVNVERKLFVDAERDSTVVVVQFECGSPRLAQAVCDAIVNVYQREHMRIHRNAESSLFLAEQSNRLQGQLEESLEELRQLKNEAGLSSVDDRRTTLESQFSSIELESYNTGQQLATAEATIAELEGELAYLPERMVASMRSVPNEGADMLREQLYVLQMNAMDLKARYHDSHPLVQAVDLQLEEAQSVMANQALERTETTDDVNPIYRELSLNLKQQRTIAAGLRARLAELESQRGRVLADLRTVNDYDIKVDEAQRSADLARAKYMQYAVNLEQARMDQELQNERISNVSVVQAATLSEKPVSPSKLLVAIGTMLLAVAGTGTLIYAKERLNDKLRTEEEVEHLLGVPVLGSIPDEREYRRVLPTGGNGVSSESGRRGSGTS